MFHDICCTKLRNHYLVCMGNLYSQIDVKINHFVCKPYHCFHTMEFTLDLIPVTLGDKQETDGLCIFFLYLSCESKYHTLLQYTIVNHIWVAFHATSIWSEPSLHAFLSQICVTLQDATVDSKGWTCHKPWPETLVILFACLLKHTEPNSWKIQTMRFRIRFHFLFWLYHFKILHLHKWEQYSVTIDLKNRSCFPPHEH